MATASTDNATTSEAFCIIVGAGIAGLATAIAMRAEGRRVIVLEQSRLKSEVGAAIQSVLLALISEGRSSRANATHYFL